MKMHAQAGRLAAVLPAVAATLLTGCAFRPVAAERAAIAGGSTCPPLESVASVKALAVAEPGAAAAPLQAAARDPQLRRVLDCLQRRGGRTAL